AALTAARAVQGAGAAFLVVLSVAMARDLAAEGRAGGVMGTLGAVSAIGTGLGPTLGGLLLAGVGWRAVFLALAAPAAAALALAWRALPRGGGEVPAAPPTEGRRAAARIWPGLAANLLVAAVMMTTLVVGPFFLGLGLGLSVAATGLAMSAGPAISALSAMPLGRLVDAWGTARARRAGLAALACGALGLSLAATQPAGPAALALWFVAIAALTPGYQLFQAANNVAALEAADPARRGAASGLLSLSRNIGLTAGASVMGWVFAQGAGGVAPETANPETIAAGTRLTFVVAFALVLAAAALTHGERPEREATGSDGKP
ncbi:MAG: MFS transporter, partial [Pseudomonadota bacterium]|nr:MFS transporter [Pseudomonadota bacterium]